LKGKKPVLRVSYISQISWCQRKAQLLLQGRLVEEETEAMREGREVASRFGFDEEVLVRRDFGDFVVEGHVDKVDNSDVIEFKVHRGTYPLRFLLATAHAQANLYGFLKGAETYSIIVYLPKEARMLHFGEEVNPFRAQRMIAMGWFLFQGIFQPIPTTYRWKCRVCQARKQGLCKGC